jgi:hypothetical protein
MKAYLQPIRICSGVFFNEKNVVLEDYLGTRTFGFFDNKYLRNDKLEITLLEERGGLVEIKLPLRTIEIRGDKEYLTVKRESIEYALK